MKRLETMTFETKHGDPSTVYCEGHRDVKTFNKAFKKEWGELGNYSQDDLEYVYCIIKFGKGRSDGVCKVDVKRCSPNKIGAKKFTVAKWD